MGIPISKKYGGGGARPLVHSLTLERFGQLGLGVVTFVDVHQALGSLTIQEWGNEEQKQRYLTKAATGEVVLAYALTEPEAGSDPVSLKTQFRKEGDDYYLTGSKYLISNGSVADRVIVFAYPEGQTKGMTAFLVDAKEKGFSVDMRLEEKMGLFTSDTAMLSFDDLRVTKEDVIGEEGRGLAVAYSALLNGRIGIASGCLGVMEDCLNQVKERTSSRTQHGKPIGKHQLIQRHIAKIASNLESVEMAGLPGRAEEGGVRRQQGRPRAPLGGGQNLGGGEVRLVEGRVRIGRQRGPVLRRIRLLDTLAGREAPDRHPRREDLRGDRRDDGAEDRLDRPGQGLRGVQVEQEGIKTETGGGRTCNSILKVRKT